MVINHKILFGLGLLVLLLSPAVYATYANPAAPFIGSAGNYVILAETTITDTGVTGIVGDIASSGTGAAIGVPCSDITGTIYDIDGAYTGGGGGSTVCRTTASTDVGNAVLAMTNGYTNAGIPTPDLTNTNGGNLGGLTLTRGVYAFNGPQQNVIINGGNLTLSGSADDVWIFQIEGTFKPGKDLGNENVVLTGGAQAKNVYWAVAGETTIYPGSSVSGIILDAKGIAMQLGSSLNGRALAQTAVTMIGNSVSIPVIIPPVPVPLSNSSNVSACLEINTSGAYRMNTSLAGAPIPATPLSGTACVKIVSSNVIFDCNNFRITNNGTGATTYGILVTNTSRNVSVYNCPGVSQYSYGVEIFSSNNTNFVNLITHNNTVNGFLVNSSANNSVSGSISYSNGGGFRFTNTVGGTNTLANVSAHNSLGDVFQFDTTGPNTLTNCIAANNAGDAFSFDTTGPNTLTRNTAYGNSNAFTIDTGIPSNTLIGNIAFNNTGTGTSITDSNASITNSHYYNNALDFQVSGTGNIINLSGVIFDGPGGNFTNDTNLSVNDVVDTPYSISHSAQPAPLPPNYTSFANKYVEIIGPADIDSATWNWMSSELAVYNQNRFQLWLYNGTNWTNTTSTWSRFKIVYSNISSLGVFAILQSNATNPSNETTSGGNHQASQQLSIGFSTSCSGNTVTVSNSNPVQGATVVVDGNTIGTTNSDGLISFSGCGKTVTVYARGTGYQSASEQETLVSCGQCQTTGGCSISNDCPASQACSGNSCVAVSCPNGQVVNHQCVPNQAPQTNQTQPATQCTAPSCCTADSKCGDNQRCSIASGSTNGSCQQVTGRCGYIANHAWVQYQCGSGADCPQCPSGQSCMNSQCVQMGVSCPTSGSVGTTVTCVLTQNNNACANCQAIVTVPDGTKSTVTADANGNIRLPLPAAGNYQVANGQSTAQVTVKPQQTTPVTPATQPAQDSGLLPFVLLLILLAVVIGAIVYWYMIGKKKK